MVYSASHWRRKADKLASRLVDVSSNLRRGKEPISFTKPRPEPNTIDRPDGPASDNDRLSGYREYFPFAPMLKSTYDLNKRREVSPDRRLRILMVYAIGDWMTSPQARRISREARQACRDTPGMSLCKTVDMLASSRKRPVDITTQLLRLAYYTLLGDERNIETVLQVIQCTWHVGARAKCKATNNGYVAWTYYGFMYYQCPKDRLKVGAKFPGRPLKLKPYHPVVYMLAFRTGLFQVQFRSEFGMYEGVQHRAKQLNKLLVDYDLIFERPGRYGASLIPLMAEWHLKFLFSGWQMLEEFLTHGQDGPMFRACCPSENLKLLGDLQNSLKSLLGMCTTGAVRTAAVLFCQNWSNGTLQVLWAALKSHLGDIGRKETDTVSTMKLEPVADDPALF